MVSRTIAYRPTAFSQEASSERLPWVNSIYSRVWPSMSVTHKPDASALTVNLFLRSNSPRLSIPMKNKTLQRPGPTCAQVNPSPSHRQATWEVDLWLQDGSEQGECITRLREPVALGCSSMVQPAPLQRDLKVQPLDRVPSSLQMLGWVLPILSSSALSLASIGDQALRGSCFVWVW